MALHRSAPPRHVVVSIGLAVTLAGCVGTSDAIDVPEATVTPTSTDRVDIAVDTAPVVADSTPVSEPGDPVSAATDPPVTDPAVTDPPATQAPTPDPPVAAPPATDPAPTAPEPAPDPFLRIGDEGDDVGIMQLKLRALGYLAPGYSERVFDRPTADALIDFQAQYGLVVDGIFGPETDRSLSAAAASVDPDG